MTKLAYLREQGKTQVTLTLPDELAQEVGAIAIREGVPRQSVLFWAVRDYLNRQADLETQDRAS